MHLHVLPYILLIELTPSALLCNVVNHNGRQPACARQFLIDLRHRVSNNMAKQPLTAHRGGISTRRRETPGFLPERGFLIRFILPLSTLGCSFPMPCCRRVRVVSHHCRLPNPVVAPTIPPFNDEGAVSTATGPFALNFFANYIVSWYIL